jgi:hypothetical protein
MTMIVNQNTLAKSVVKKLSFSFSSNMRNTSIKHNERKPEDQDVLKDYGKHISWDRTADNEILVSKNIKDVYKEVFQSSVDEYNKKQKRADRKIKNFFSKVKKSKNLDTQKEFIIQAGKVGQQLDSDPAENERLQKQVLETYLDNFQQTYPQLHVYSAVIHVDEKSPHMHLAVVPEASGYKRGVSKQPSFSKAVGIKNIDDFREFCEANRNLLKQSVEQVLGADVQREEVGTHAYLPPQALRDAWAKADEKTRQAEETLDDAKDEADAIVSKAKKEAEKIASDAKSKADVNREVMQYRADQMSQVDNAVKAYHEQEKTKVDNALVAYKAQERSKVHNELKAYGEEEKAKADADADKTRKDAETDASLILSDAKSKRVAATAKETELAGREAEITTRETALKINEDNYTSDLQLLQKQQEELKKKEQDVENRQQELEKQKKELQAWEDALEEKEKKFTEKVLDFWKRIKKWNIKRVKKLGHLADEQMHKEKPMSDIDEIEAELDAMHDMDQDQDKGLQQ